MQDRTINKNIETLSLMKLILIVNLLYEDDVVVFTISEHMRYAININAIHVDYVCVCVTGHIMNSNVLLISKTLIMCTFKTVYEQPAFHILFTYSVSVFSIKKKGTQFLSFYFPSSFITHTISNNIFPIIIHSTNKSLYVYLLRALFMLPVCKVITKCLLRNE